MKRLSLLNLALALALSLFIISAAVVLTLNFRPLFYMDIELLDIPSMCGLSPKLIRENYDALISYNSILGPDTLVLPGFPMSDNGRIHFEEVKAIFLFFEYMLFATASLSLAGIIYRRRNKNPGYLLYTGILGLGLPLLLGAFVAADWKRAFTLFHKIAFRNDFWLFSPKDDPVITMLPNAFFMHCAIMILSLIAIGSIICLLCYRKSRK